MRRFLHRVLLSVFLLFAVISGAFWLRSYTSSVETRIPGPVADLHLAGVEEAIEPPRSLGRIVEPQNDLVDAGSLRPPAMGV